MTYPATQHSKSEQKVNAELQDYLSQLPSSEPWLNSNAEARASVERGLEQAAIGQGVYLGSFAEFGDTEIEN